jgi:hypothetical protein
MTCASIALFRPCAGRLLRLVLGECGLLFLIHCSSTRRARASSQIDGRRGICSHTLCGGNLFGGSLCTSCRCVVPAHTLRTGLGRRLRLLTLACIRERHVSLFRPPQRFPFRHLRVGQEATPDLVGCLDTADRHHGGVGIILAVVVEAIHVGEHRIGHPELPQRLVARIVWNVITHELCVVRLVVERFEVEIGKVPYLCTFSSFSGLPALVLARRIAGPRIVAQCFVRRAHRQKTLVIVRRRHGGLAISLARTPLQSRPTCKKTLV